MVALFDRLRVEVLRQLRQIDVREVDRGGDVLLRGVELVANLVAEKCVELGRKPRAPGLFRGIGSKDDRPADLAVSQGWLSLHRSLALASVQYSIVDVYADSRSLPGRNDPNRGS
ncbi:hypothetical protein [Rhodococcus sp. NPDC006774]|uniref:hypothetical protein n=1 Tax=Rhodococcus sp. NPDC006774 TaxID=3157186 RepID=UPI0033F06E8F